ncbi:hypothetical protein Y1Q_0019483 [Alligator mississippiensis]|uniref:Uncharacterized protein n=1 Tax=Alligator mississippiensis TaxID=8496 RepID=A0A151NNG9_ALLMI|nr:hypothetical protein Y1Q_0019483 [Alligator mississippiensis]
MPGANIKGLVEEQQGVPEAKSPTGLTTVELNSQLLLSSESESAFQLRRSNCGFCSCKQPETPETSS